MAAKRPLLPFVSVVSPVVLCVVVRAGEPRFRVRTSLGSSARLPAPFFQALARDTRAHIRHAVCAHARVRRALVAQCGSYSFPLFCVVDVGASISNFK